MQYDMAIRNARLTVVRDAINGGTLEIGTDGMGNVLASVQLPTPVGTVSDGVLTLTMPQTDPVGDATGNAAAARIKDSSGNVRISDLSVGTSGCNINLSSTAIQQLAGVTITSAIIIHA